MLYFNSNPEKESAINEEHAIYPSDEQRNAEKNGSSQNQNVIRNVPGDLVRFPICSLHVSERYIPAVSCTGFPPLTTTAGNDGRTIQRASPISSHVYAHIDSALASNPAPPPSVSIFEWFLWPFVAEHVTSSVMCTMSNCTKPRFC